MNLIKKITLMTMITFSTAMADEISFQTQGTTETRAVFVNGDLCKVKNRLTEFLSEMNCADVQIKYGTELAGLKNGLGGFFDTEYTLTGKASCSSISSLKLNIKIAPCEDCHTITKLTITQTDGSQTKKQFSVDEPIYGCQ